MQGDLAGTSTVDLCLGLADQATTGTLLLSAVAGTAELRFVDGHLAGGRAPATSMGGARLGERLVGVGRLDPADLETVLAEQVADVGWVPLGQRLVDRGLVSVDVVRLGLQEQALDALQAVAGWFEGSFQVEAHAPSTGVRVAMPVQRALREVARRTDDRRELALQAVGHAADRTDTTPSREEFDLSASPTTGTRPVGLTDQGWAERVETTPASRDEPEPWVGWANGARHAEQAPSTPAPPRTAPPPASPPTAPAPPPASAPATAAARHEVSWPGDEATSGPQAAPAAAGPGTPTSPPDAARPSRSLDAETRRELFSELHEMGQPTTARAVPTPPATPQHEPPPPQDEAEVEVQGEAPDEIEVAPPGPPPPSLSRSDVSELLAELHALNLDDDGR